VSVYWLENKYGKSLQDLQAHDSKCQSMKESSAKKENNFVTRGFACISTSVAENFFTMLSFNHPPT
jgi:hypothetical protein